MMYAAFLTIRDPELNQAVRPAHLAYIAKLHQDGKVLLAGPFHDGSGGMVIYQNVTESEALSLAEGDPIIASGARELKLAGWNPLDLTPYQS